MAKFNKKLESRLLEIEEDNNNMRIMNEALEEERESIFNNNSVLQKKLEEAELTIKSYLDKIGFLEQQFKETYTSNQVLTKQVYQLKSDIQQFSSGSKKLDNMLGLGQTNKLGLGYERTYVEKELKSTTKVSTISKEKVCHRCGIKGHIKKNCPNKDKKNILAPSTTRLPPRDQLGYQLGRVPRANRKSKPQRQYQPNRISKSKTQAVWVSKNQQQANRISKSQRLHQSKKLASKGPTVDKKSKQLVPKVDKPRQPKIRQVWIRKGDIFPCFSS